MKTFAMFVAAVAVAGSLVLSGCGQCPPPEEKSSSSFGGINL